MANIGACGHGCRPEPKILLDFPPDGRDQRSTRTGIRICNNRENQTKYQGWFISVQFVHCRIGSSERDLFSLSMFKLVHPLVPA